MTRPRVRSATEFPVISWTDWDNVQMVKASIRALELGVFDAASNIVEAMGRDDRISGCLETRTRALAGLPLAFEPRGDGRQKKAVADALDDVFEEMFPDATLTELLQWGLILGVGIAENVWEFGESAWLPRLKVWHPRFLTFRMDTRSFWLNTQEGQREITPGDGQWVLYTPYGLARGWMHGKVRSLYVPWLMRTWGLRDWARYSEVHGMPIKKVVTPAAAQENDRNAFLAAVAGIGTEATIRTPRVMGGTGDPDADRYDIELLEAMSQNWQTFDKLLDKAEACIAINLLGQNLTTEVKGGSYAAAQSHMQIRNEVLQFDAESLAQCLRHQVLSWWALHNYGNAELAPMPKWKTGARSDAERKTRGEALQALGTGFTLLRTAGVKVDVDQVLEEEDVPTTAPSEDPPPPPALAPGAAPAGAQGPSARPPGAGRPIAQASQQKDEGAASVPPSAVEGQGYLDRLGDDGTEKLKAAFAKSFRELGAIVADAPDYATLRGRLLAAYGEMEAEAETELLYRGMLMSELAGRYAARKEAGVSVEPAEDEGNGEA